MKPFIKNTPEQVLYGFGGAMKYKGETWPPGDKCR